MTDRSIISQTIVAKEYMRCAIVRNHPEIPSHEFDQIGQDNIDKYKTEGLALAADLYFKLELAEYSRTIDEFSGLHIEPVVIKKYPKK